MITLCLFYFAFGVLITAFAWPSLRRVWWENSWGGDFIKIVLAAILWPFSVTIAFYLGCHFYKNYWVEFLMRRDRNLARRMQSEFENRWYGVAAPERSKFGYETKKATLEDKVKKLNERSRDRFYYLEEQAREGLWFNPFERRQD